MVRPKFIFRIKGDEPEAPSPKVAELTSEIEKMEEELAFLRGETHSADDESEPATVHIEGRESLPGRPARRTPQRRLVIGPCVKFDEWAPLLKDTFESEYKLAFAGDANRVDIMPKDDEEAWRITVLAFMEQEFAITMFYNWKHEEYLNIKKHALEYITQNHLIPAIEFLIEHKSKFRKE